MAGKILIKCPKCGGERKPKGKWRGAVCSTCRNKERNDARRKKRGRVYLSACFGADPTIDPYEVYIIKKCDVCYKDFFPVALRNIRCESCAEVANMVYTRITSPAYSFYKNAWKERRRISQASISDVARRYIASVYCAYCKRPYSDDRYRCFDHIVPISLGGSSEADNIEICCRACNYSKFDKPLKEWIESCAFIAIHAGLVSPKRPSYDTETIAWITSLGE